VQGRGISQGECLACHQYAEGNVYPFYVVVSQSISYRIVHEEQPFICTACAEARIRANGWLALFYWTPLSLLGFLLTFWSGLRAYKFGNPLRWGYLPRVGGLFLLSGGLLIITCLILWAVVRQFRYARRENWLPNQFPDSSVTKMAIGLRKKDVLKTLQRSEAGVRFLTAAERWGRIE
jgi:hypothetical protein